MIIEKRKTVFDILREADEDDVNSITNGSIDAGDKPPADTTTQDNPGTGDTATDNAGDDNNDLNIDASLDTNNDDLGGGGDTNTDTSTSTDTSFGSSSSTTGSTDEEPIKKNTDIFANLTSEEQAIKISELKKQYNDLYTSCDDYLARFNDVDYDNINIRVVERITTAMNNLKRYLKDYILNVFPIRSYIENDYKYNEFIYIYHSIASILEDVGASKKAKKD